MAIKRAGETAAVDTEVQAAAAAAESPESRQAHDDSSAAAAALEANVAAQDVAVEVVTEVQQAQQAEQEVASQACGDDVLEEEEAEEPAPAAPAADTAAQAAQAQAGQAVAPANSNTAMANTAAGRSNFFKQIVQELNDEGFEGVELDYSSFLNVTLNKQIESSEGHELPNSGFVVRIASSRLKYCFRNNNPVEDEVEVAYSYDPNAATDPASPVYEAIQKWKQEGLDLAPGKDGVKIYTEVMAMMVEDGLEGDEKGTLVGRLITLQVAPTSKGRWAGYLAQLKMQGKTPSDVLTRCRRGKKIESGKFPFFPWDFIYAGEAPAL